jgi:sulfur carrier protein ThiS
MPTVSFTSALQRFMPVPTMQVDAATVSNALAAVFATHPTLRGYVLDDQGALRRHVAVYVNGDLVRDRSHLADPVHADDEIHVFQALTGG